MISRHYKSEPIKETVHKVDVRQIYDDVSAQMNHISLNPGETLKPHKTPVDVVFYILEGSPTIHVGKESIVFEKDSLVESPKDIVHCLSNQSDTIARILVIKAPKPTTNTKVL